VKLTLGPALPWSTDVQHLKSIALLVVKLKTWPKIYKIRWLEVVWGYWMVPFNWSHTISYKHSIVGLNVLYRIHFLKCSVISVEDRQFYLRHVCVFSNQLVRAHSIGISWIPWAQKTRFPALVACGVIICFTLSINCRRVTDGPKNRSRTPAVIYTTHSNDR